MKSFVGIMLLGMLAVAQAQVYPNYFSGYFGRADRVNSRGFARWDPNNSRWYTSPVSTWVSGSVTHIDVETHPSNKNLVYSILSESAGTDSVSLFDAEAQSWLHLGESFPQNSLRDLFIDGNDMFLCGTFTLGNSRHESIAYRTVDAPARTLWSNPYTDANTPNSCQKIFAFPITGRTDKTVVLVTGNQLQWKSSAGTWTTTPSNVASNIRSATGTDTAVVTAANARYFEGYLYLYSASGYTLSTDSSNTVYNWIRTNDGINFERYLRMTGDYTVFEWWPVPGGSDMFILADFSNSARNGYSEPGLYRASAPRELAQTAQRIGNYISGLNNLRIFTLRSMPNQVILHDINNANPAFYNDPAGWNFANGAGDIARYRYYWHIASNFYRVDYRFPTTSEWLSALGGGLSNSVNRITENADATMVYATGGFDTAWNVAARGLAAYNDKTKRFISVGNPLADSTSNGVNVNPYSYAMQHWKNSDDSQTILVAGGFSRIRNVTTNSLAFIRTTDIAATADTQFTANWRAAAASNGEVGVTLVRNTALNPGNSATLVPNPGEIYATFATPSRLGSNARRVFVGGYFNKAGNVSSQCIARVDIDGVAGTVEWRGMGGGLANFDNNDYVKAVWAVGSKVFVAGQFTVAGNVSASNIAMWDDDKETWHPLGSGVDAFVYDILDLPGNRILVGGAFSTAGGLPSPGLAIWHIGDQKWERIQCDRCTARCDKQYAESSGSNSAGNLCETLLGDNVSVEDLDRAGDKIMVYFRSDNYGRSYFWYDDANRVVRLWEPSAGLNQEWQWGSRMMMPAPAGEKADVWFAGYTSMTSNIQGTYFMEFDSRTGNVFFNERGGFDSYVGAVSSAHNVAINAVALVTMALAVVVALAL